MKSAASRRRGIGRKTRHAVGKSSQGPENRQGADQPEPRSATRKTAISAISLRIRTRSSLEAAIHSNLRETTTRVLASLTPREERVLRMRFGIGMNTDHTLEEVGQQFSVTRERIRQIEAKALRKLKHQSVTQAAQLPRLLKGCRRPHRRRAGAMRQPGESVPGSGLSGVRALDRDVAIRCAPRRTPPRCAS